MADFTLRTTVRQPYEQTVAAVRDHLVDAGFGVLTEIDLRATLQAKLGVDVAPQVILGACRPQLAHRALEAEPSIAALLPCNVVVRSLDADTTVVEAFDPEAMTSMAGAALAGTPGAEALQEVAADARQRLAATLDAVSSGPATRAAGEGR